MKVMKIDNFEEVIENEKRLQGQCYIDGDVIVLNVRYPYEIERGSCATHSDIISWSVHLVEKNWITKELLRRFMVVAEEFIKTVY